VGVEIGRGLGGGVGWRGWELGGEGCCCGWCWVRSWWLSGWCWVRCGCRSGVWLGGGWRSGYGRDGVGVWERRWRVGGIAGGLGERGNGVDVAAGGGWLRNRSSGRLRLGGSGWLRLGFWLQRGGVDVGVAGSAGKGGDGLRCLCRGMKRDYCRRQEGGQGETGKHGEGSWHGLQQTGEDSRASAGGAQCSM